MSSPHPGAQINGAPPMNGLEAMDFEIQNLQNKVDRLRRQRQMIELQEKIALEEKLLNAARHRLELATGANGSQSPAPAPDPAPAPASQDTNTYHHAPAPAPTAAAITAATPRQARPDRSELERRIAQMRSQASGSPAQQPKSTTTFAPWLGPSRSGQPAQQSSNPVAASTNAAPIAPAQQPPSQVSQSSQDLQAAQNQADGVDAAPKPRVVHTARRTRDSQFSTAAALAKKVPVGVAQGTTDPEPSQNTQVISHAPKPPSQPAQSQAVTRDGLSDRQGGNPHLASQAAPNREERREPPSAPLSTRQAASPPERSYQSTSYPENDDRRRPPRDFSRHLSRPTSPRRARSPGYSRSRAPSRPASRYDDRRYDRRECSPGPRDRRPSFHSRRDWSLSPPPSKRQASDSWRPAWDRSPQAPVNSFSSGPPVGDNQQRPPEREKLVFKIQTARPTRTQSQSTNRDATNCPATAQREPPTGPRNLSNGRASSPPPMARSDGTTTQHARPNGSQKPQQPPASSANAAPSAAPRAPRNQQQPPSAPSGAPPSLQIPMYETTRFGFMKDFINNLEAHFSAHPDYYNTESRKITAGLRHIEPKMHPAWQKHLTQFHVANPTWFDFRTFLAYQTRQGENVEHATREYMRAAQRDEQPVSEFALWMQGLESYVPRLANEKERMKGIYDRILPVVRKKLQKNFNQFEDYHEFIAYMQEVENSMPERATQIASRKAQGRKRGRDSR
ncbi:hypothetical protein N7474_007509 [Penicillium riverlandense]|uniref:uncharacterized protein n=1 Tax=Penicillium riverlandense TaxID=1903569 RepID=UPI002548C1F7|nr:uncharacterized protein N7474_007509 [Penicillium riverlandense]KAJ5815732.1 hypothetical protein N7474_007509 [Penicillium riverlandense]